MDWRKIIRNVVLWTLDQVLEVAYWILALVGLVKLGSGIHSTTLMSLATFVYCASVIAFYFLLVKKLKHLLCQRSR